MTDFDVKNTGASRRRLSDPWRIDLGEQPRSRVSRGRGRVCHDSLQFWACTFFWSLHSTDEIRYRTLTQTVVLSVVSNLVFSLVDLFPFSSGSIFFFFLTQLGHQTNWADFRQRNVRSSPNMPCISSTQPHLSLPKWSGRELTHWNRKAWPGFSPSTKFYSPFFFFFFANFSKLFNAEYLFMFMSTENVSKKPYSFLFFFFNLKEWGVQPDLNLRR